MKGNSSKKKLLVAASVVGVILLAAIVSVVAVFAASTQNVSSSVKVTYTVSDVSATVSARQAIANAESITDKGSVTFTADQTTQTGSLNFTDVTLSSTNSYVVYEFKFLNNGAKGFNATLTASPATQTNIILSYQVSSTALSGTNFNAMSGTTFTSSTLSNVKTFVAAGSGKVSYVYIKAAIGDLNSAASLSGSFSWSLVAADAAA